MRHAVFLAPFGPFADPERLLDLARAAEESGWDGLFLWDHTLRRESDEILDPWVMLGALAAATDRLRLGPMITPIVRRRLIKLAREIVTVDAVSAGRLTLGLGLGVDTNGELSRFGEVTDAKTRGAMLDEGVPVLADLLAGETVEHRGEHFTVDGVYIEPRSPQGDRPPFWFAARGDARKPIRRAARYEGVFPIEMDAERYGRLLDTVVEERGTLDGFDIAMATDPGEPVADFAADTATWAIHAWPAVAEPDAVFNTVVHGPPS
ncbi:MAG: LLM class flavin-dependent oxidoreductase [Actinomycetota bacterium]